MFYKLIVCMFIVGFALPGNAQNKGKKFTLEDFNLTYTVQDTMVFSGLRSLNDGEHYTVLEDKGKKLVMYSYKTGKAVSTLLDLNDPKYKAVQTIQDYEFSPEEDRILICTNINPIYRRSFTADYFVFDFKNKELNLYRKVVLNVWQPSLLPERKWHRERQQHLYRGPTFRFRNSNHL